MEGAAAGGSSEGQTVRTSVMALLPVIGYILVNGQLDVRKDKDMNTLRAGMPPVYDDDIFRTMTATQCNVRNLRGERHYFVLQATMCDGDRPSVLLSRLETPKEISACREELGVAVIWLTSLFIHRRFREGKEELLRREKFLIDSKALKITEKEFETIVRTLYGLERLPWILTGVFASLAREWSVPTDEERMMEGGGDDTGIAGPSGGHG